MVERVLLLDSDQALAPLLKAHLMHGGADFVVAESPERVPLLIQGGPCVALVLMAELDRWKAVLPLLAAAARPIPLVVVARQTDPLDLSSALRAGARDVVLCPCSSLHLFRRLGLVVAQPVTEEQTETPFTLLLGASVRAGARALVAVAAALQARPPARERQRLEATQVSLRQTFDRMIAAALGSAEGGTRTGHAHRVSQHCALIGEALGLSPFGVAAVQTAGLLADASLETTSMPWLDGDKALNEDQWRAVMSHPARAAALSQPLSALGVPIPAILAHHERLDGSGYPDGLSGARIGTEARVLAVADVYVGLTSYRRYREARTIPEALSELNLEVESGRLCGQAVSALVAALDVRREGTGAPRARDAGIEVVREESPNDPQAATLDAVPCRWVAEAAG